MWPKRNRTRLISLPLTLVLMGGAAQAEDKAGAASEITMVREWSQTSSDQSTGESYDRDTLVERIIRVRPDGLVLEYDLPKSATADERASDWHFPARVFKPHQGPPQLLNRSELEGRIDPWLKAANWTREICGRWIFTWNAFRIDCDPESVIETVEGFDLRSVDLRHGAPFRDPSARSTGALTRKAGSSGNAMYTVELEIDPDAVRRARAETDVAVGEIMRKPVSLEVSLRERAKEVITGTISITFETDAAGNIRRRTKVTKIQTIHPNGESDTETTTQTLERRPI